jgi:hypothetical protein
MTKTSRWIYATTFLLAAAGALLPFWPLCVAGILIAAFSGRWLFAVGMALLVDVAWGAPTGMLHFLYFPFTLLALLGAAVRVWGSRYFLDRNIQEKL